MTRLTWLTMLALAAQPLAAQQPFGGAPQPTAPDSSSAPASPEGVKWSIDSFTGDTIWETKYGRLDEAKGCSRSNLAIVWKFVRGSRGRSEWLTYDYIDVEGPFSEASWLNTVQAAVNVDGRIIEAQLHPLGSRLGHGGIMRRDKTESAAFLLPDSTLRLVADAKVAKIRFVGREKTCDGIVEQNMKDRLRTLLAAVR